MFIVCLFFFYLSIFKLKYSEQLCFDCNSLGRTPLLLLDTTATTAFEFFLVYPHLLSVQSPGWRCLIGWAGCPGWGRGRLWFPYFLCWEGIYFFPRLEGGYMVDNDFSSLLPSKKRQQSLIVTLCLHSLKIERTGWTKGKNEKEMCI